LVLAQQGRTIEVVNQAENGKEELLTDLVAIVYACAARLYGQRRVKRKTDVIMKELTEEEHDATG
jgi:predicted site-specific integrase-resolvase